LPAAESGALTYTIVLAGRASLNASLCARPTKSASPLLVASMTVRTTPSTRAPACSSPLQIVRRLVP
jgi:hypothetical protein